MVGVSSALQTVFECVMPAKHYPGKKLPDAALLELIGQLSAKDHQRAGAFAERNQLHREYGRFRELVGGIQVRADVRGASHRSFDLYFYDWQVGTLAVLSAGEFRFTYAPDWAIGLSRELPLRDGGGISYEGPSMPAFFENFLPEGWAENRIIQTYGIDRDDRTGLLASTRKYLSNFTLRPLGIPLPEFRFDSLATRLADVAPDDATIIECSEHVARNSETPGFWREMKMRGAVGLSGIQPKLPVSLSLESGRPSIRVGDLRTPCTHILKFQSPHYEFLVENEWVTMELARRAGLDVAPARLVAFDDPSPFHGYSLLVERYDVPDRAALERADPALDLVLQEDACSLLLLPRSEKYRTSLERVATALRDAGLSSEPVQSGLWSLVRHVAFSWLAGNGDLHAKNISLLRIIHGGKLGAPPKVAGLRYSPLYDLLNTAVAIGDQEFALPVNGRHNNIRSRDIAELATRWNGSRFMAEEQILAVAQGIRRSLDDVLQFPFLPDAMRQRYREVVIGRLQSLGVA
jgi:serine/threonine-protein kinase HipA